MESAIIQYAGQHDHVKKSLDIIAKALTTIKYDFSQFAVSFNGGKDCTVMLALLRAVLVENKCSDLKLNAVYIHEPDTFPEIVDFIASSVERYNLNLITFEKNNNFKAALEKFKLSEKGSKVDAIFMGTRSSDVSYNLVHAQRTDPGWPDFLRVNPILDWSYHEVWDFLRQCNVAYCSLYDKGYTSLGSKSSTNLNPRLKSVTPDGQVTYLPAYFLDDPGTERSGRSK